jgi:hypothetical protein
VIGPTQGEDFQLLLFAPIAFKLLADAVAHFSGRAEVIHGP